jgi:copper transport protein
MPCLIAATRQLSGALALLVLPSLASAHTSLRRSVPERGSRLTVPPTRIALWFTARPQLGFSKLRLVGPAGDVPLDRLVADSGNAIYANIPGTLPPGEYAVEWQTASADGHAIRGEIVFAVLGVGQSTTAPMPPMQEHHAPQPEAHEGHSEYRTARWLEFAALLTVLGALGFRHGVLPPLAARGVPTSDAADRARRLGQSALAVYAIASIIRLYTESVAVHGTDRALDMTELVPMVTTTTWGVGWLMGLVGAGLLLVGWIVTTRSTTIGTPLALTGAFAMVLSPALSGHAAASQHAIVSVTFDVIHMTAAGVWLGGLLMVVVAGLPAMRRLADGDRDAAVGSLVNSFHPVALFCAPIVVLAGLGTSWLRLASLSNLWTTEYGRNLLWKIAWVLVVVTMGMYNSVRARRRLGSATATRHFRRTATLELLFAAVVLAVTTVLVSSPVPSEMAGVP